MFRESVFNDFSDPLVTVMRCRPREMGGLRNPYEALQDLLQGEVSISNSIYARWIITDGFSAPSYIASAKDQQFSRRTTWISSARYLSSLVKLDLVWRDWMIGS